MPQFQDTSKTIDSLDGNHSFDIIAIAAADSTDNFLQHTEQQHLMDLRIDIRNLIYKLEFIKSKIDSINSTKIDTTRR